MTSDPRAPLDFTATGTMLLLSLCWGFQQVAIKLAAPDVPFLVQGSLRSIGATMLVVAWARWRNLPLLRRDGTLAPGVVAGIAFAGEFALIYAGLAHTTAARMIVFLYTAPCLTAIGLALFVPGERLTPLQWAGIVVAFAGIATAFGEGAIAGAGTWIGDLCGLLAALLWAATTVLVRASRLARASATKVLLYQLAVSALLLPLASVAVHEPAVRAFTPVAIASLAFQAIAVAFASYLAWFWLLTRYLASRLAVFSFLTPLFGVMFGTLVLREPLSPGFVWAAALVALGIVLVNAKRGPREAGAAALRTSRRARPR